MYYHAQQESLLLQQEPLLLQQEPLHSHWKSITTARRASVRTQLDRERKILPNPVQISSLENLKAYTQTLKIE